MKMVAKTTMKRTEVLAVSLLLATAVLIAENTIAREGSTTREGATPSPEAISPPRSRASAAPKAAGNDGRRLREGTLITDQSGFFREDGDGATFVAESEFEFGALPNLNLERVVRLLKSAEEPSSIRWSVTGTVTEFSGRNFLLISRAIYKSAAPPPIPDRVAP